jgi:hypothetical protein
MHIQGVTAGPEEEARQLAGTSLSIDTVTCDPCVDKVAVRALNDGAVDVSSVSVFGRRHLNSSLRFVNTSSAQGWGVEEYGERVFAVANGSIEEGETYTVAVTSGGYTASAVCTSEAWSIGEESYSDVPVTSGLIGHYDAADLDRNGGDALETWPDLSGAGNNAEQTDTDLQPVYRVSQGCSPSFVEYDADRMDTGIRPEADDLADDFTVFVAGYADSGGEYFYGFLYHDDDDTRHDIVHWTNRIGDNEYSTRTGTSTDKTGSAYSLGTWYVGRHRFDNFARDASFYVGGEEDMDYIADWEATSDLPSHLPGFALGGRGGEPSRQTLDGGIGELLIYDRDLDDSDAAAVENYLQDKWIN